MSYFDTDFLKFFKELEQNNSKKWFDTNRKRYVKNIKEPFYKFIQEMIIRLQDEDDDLYTDPKESIFRINRDLRFSKDKTPYKIQTSAALSTGGRKAIDSPGYYIQLSHNRMMFGGGLYNPSKDGLYRIRSYIKKYPTRLSKLVEEQDFKDNFGKLLGEKNKRVPIEFKNLSENQPASLIDNKQFYYMQESTDVHDMLKSDFINHIIPVYKAGLNINRFLRKGLIP